MHALEQACGGGAGGGGKGRLDRGALADARLDAPLPWDHINTGVSKVWLKTDLQRALEAATVPDCSHSGLCSECGVCGDEFGENVVAEAPPIPAFEGHYVPDTRRVQRVRLTFSKTGDMVFVGHLDLLRLLERACRRAALPTSADASPFNPRTRMSYCAALPLGATSSAEVVEVVMTERCDAEDVRARLQAQVPGGLEFTRAEGLDVYRLNGSLAESLTVLTRSVTYELLVRQRGAAGGGALPPVRDAARAVLAAREFVVTKETKKKKRAKRVDLRPQVLRMQPLRRPFESQIARYAPAVLGKVALGAPAEHAWAVVEVEVALSGDGGHLKPADAIRMLTELSGRDFELRHVHRCARARAARCAWLTAVWHRGVGSVQRLWRTQHMRTLLRGAYKWRRAGAAWTSRRGSPRRCRRATGYICLRCAACKWARRSGAASCRTTWLGAARSAAPSCLSARTWTCIARTKCCEWVVGGWSF